MSQDPWSRPSLEDLKQVLESIGKPLRLGAAGASLVKYLSGHTDDPPPEGVMES